MNKKLLAVVLIPLLGLVACSRTEPPPPPAPAATVTPPPAPPATAVATLAAASGSAVKGELQLTAVADGVTIAGQITGLPPGTIHGFHVHETGDCTAPDAKSAGGHFNPAMQPHGGPTAAERHVGDLPNVEADKTGVATINATLARATLRDAGPNDLVGRAVIVHAKRDDYVTQPAGDSGDRVACGVIQ
jgi:Cu-Zn family superoxide dismutase